MADPGERDEPRPATAAAVARAGGDPEDRVRLAVEHQGRPAQLPEPRAVPLRADLAALRLVVARPAVDRALGHSRAAASSNGYAGEAIPRATARLASMSPSRPSGNLVRASLASSPNRR